MSGWLVARQQPSSAMWGGVMGGPNAIPPAVQASGWFIARRQPGTAVWGGIAAISNVTPVLAAGALVAADYDGKTWWKKKWILRL